MKARFKVKDKVKDDCGCEYEILKVGRKYYTIVNHTPALFSGTVYPDGSVTENDPNEKETCNNRIDHLDERAKLINES